MRPPEVDPKYKREQTGGDSLREKLDRPQARPGPDMPGWGSMDQGKIQNPSAPRYGDPNFKDAALTKVREDRDQQQKQQQQQRQER